MMYLINKSSIDNHHLPWGWWPHMNRLNRKLLIRTEVMENQIDFELSDGEELAAYDGQWGYRYEDALDLCRRT